jgi:hypothetical protein
LTVHECHEAKLHLPEAQRTNSFAHVPPKLYQSRACSSTPETRAVVAAAPRSASRGS